MSVELVRVEMKVNGKTVCRTIPPSMRLADFLRDELHLIGTKKGCNAGECGTCSVLIDGVLKKSCLIPAVKADHCEIVTIEGIGAEGLSVIQRCFVKVGAVQCGYWHGDGRNLHPEGKPAPGPGGNPERFGRQYLPVHRLCEDH